MLTFKVIDHAPEFSGRQITCDIIRFDGKIVRSGMKPEYAEKECKLLNTAVSENWSATKFFLAKT